MKLTDLEAEVAQRVRMGRDPWLGEKGVGSRTVSQALARLARKGAVQEMYAGGKHERRLTPEGRDALDAHFKRQVSRLVKEATRDVERSAR